MIELLTEAFKAFLLAAVVIVTTGVIFHCALGLYEWMDGRD